MKATFASACLFLSMASWALAQTPAAPYAGQESRDIKALAAEEVDAYLAGKGMGLAKAAELNGYPGPAHVLELAAQLNLTPAQRARTEAIFSEMQSKAIGLGVALVDAERKLDGLFATKSVTPASMTTLLNEIGALQAQLRAAHLEAHLAQAKVLSPEQGARYAQLRGYAAAASRPAMRDGHAEPVHGAGAHKH